MRGKRIVVGVTGGIATYKAVALVSRLSQLGADVRVIMTESATRFVTPLTFQTLSRNRVSVDTFDEQDPSVVSHIDLADTADLFIIAPATANILAKMAHGLGDDMLSTTLLAARAPILVAPAMNVHMYQNQVVQRNLQTLKNRGVYVIPPGEGKLACGYEGKGRMAEPEEIVARAEEILGASLPNWEGKRVLVTAGPTREPLDPVRYFTNHSSGKMGYAIAEAASRAGAEVVLISGPTSLATPPGVRRINVTRAEEMLQAVLKELPGADIIIKAAAVADYRPVTVHDRKMKKRDDVIEIRMERTPDILQEIGKRKGNRFLVGFAAETDNVEENALEKLRRKGMDLIVANDVTAEGAGFEVDTNIAAVYDQGGPVVRWPKMSKQRMAECLIALIGERLNAR